MHVSMPGDRMRTLYIQHPELAASLGVAFEALWAQSERLTTVDEKKSGRDIALIRVRKHSHNGQVSRAKK